MTANSKGDIIVAKNVVNVVKLQIDAGKATPAPPVGPALGQAGINIAEFTKNFNAQTQDKMGSIIPVVISVYEDRSFDFVIKTPPASDMLRKAAKIQKGSGEPNRNKVANVTMAQIDEIANAKMPDLNAFDLEGARQIILGTARSMGLTVDGQSLDDGAANAKSTPAAQTAPTEEATSAPEATASTEAEPTESEEA